VECIFFCHSNGKPLDFQNFKLRTFADRSRLVLFIGDQAALENPVLLWIFFKRHASASFTASGERRFLMATPLHTRTHRNTKSSAIYKQMLCVSGTWSIIEKFVVCVTRQNAANQTALYRHDAQNDSALDRQSQRLLPKRALRRPNKPASPYFAHYSLSLNYLLLDEPLQAKLDQHSRRGRTRLRACRNTPSE